MEGARNGLGARLVVHSNTREHEKYVRCRSAARAEKEKKPCAPDREKSASQFAKIRAVKSDLGMALWHSLEKRMANQGVDTCARKPVSAISTNKSMDVFQPVKRNQARRTLRMKVGTAEASLPCLGFRSMAFPYFHSWLRAFV